MAEGEITCANRDCRVSETGRCVEGLELTVCPHYGHERADDEELAAEDDGGASGFGLRLPGADTLTLEEASKLLRKRDARVIAIIGPKDSGKTSLIASLYDLFQEGAVGGAEYARSDTLHAFELACHDARAASRRSEPDMERTPLGEVKFYHLDLAGGVAGAGLTLLLGDRAGEEYRLAADDAAGLTSFPEIARADTLTMLVDGQRLLDAGARHNLRSEIMMILQALLDGGALRDGQRLVLVLTKFDVIQGSPNRERAEGDFRSLLAQVQRVFSTTFSQIDSCIVAASPKTAAVARGIGVVDMLTFWVIGAAPPAVSRPVVPASPRAFSRLTVVEVLEAEDA